MAMGDDLIWRLRDADEDVVHRLADALQLSPVVARLLVTRAVSDPEEARLFLDPQLSGLHDPFLLPDMEKSTLR